VSLVTFSYTGFKLGPLCIPQWLLLLDCIGLHGSLKLLNEMAKKSSCHDPYIYSCWAKPSRGVCKLLAVIVEKWEWDKITRMKLTVIMLMVVTRWMIIFWVLALCSLSAHITSSQFIYILSLTSFLVLLLLLLHCNWGDGDDNDNDKLWRSLLSSCLLLYLYIYLSATKNIMVWLSAIMERAELYF